MFPRNINQREFPPNRFNTCLYGEERIWQEINECGGLAAVCPGRKWESPPWVKMPPQGKRFASIGTLVYNGGTMPGAGDIVVPFTNGENPLIVPKGYDGCIVSVVQNFTGTGFVEGSGDITWRVRINQHYAKDYGNTKTSIGSLTTPYNVNSGQLLIQALQQIQYFVNIKTGPAISGGSFIVGLFGWFWPR